MFFANQFQMISIANKVSMADERPMIHHIVFVIHFPEQKIFFRNSISERGSWLFSASNSLKGESNASFESCQLQMHFLFFSSNYASIWLSAMTTLVPSFHHQFKTKFMSGGVHSLTRRPIFLPNEVVLLPDTQAKYTFCVV